MARQVGVVRFDQETIQMVSFPASMKFEAGFTFTVGSITWTTGVATSFSARSVPAPLASQPAPAPSAAQPVPAPSSLQQVSAPAVQNPAPSRTVAGPQAPLGRPLRHQRRPVSSSDLIELIDRQGRGLDEIMDLVESARARLRQEPDLSGFTPVRTRRRNQDRRLDSQIAPSRTRPGTLQNQNSPARRSNFSQRRNRDLPRVPAPVDGSRIEQRTQERFQRGRRPRLLNPVSRRDQIPPSARLDEFIEARRRYRSPVRSGRRGGPGLTQRCPVHPRIQDSPRASNPITREEREAGVFPIGFINAARAYERSVQRLNDERLVVISPPQEPTPTINMVVIEDLGTENREVDQVPSVSGLLAQIEQTPIVSFDCTERLSSDDDSINNEFQQLIRKGGPSTPDLTMNSDESLEYPPGFGGMVFMVSANEPIVPGETDQQRLEREARNAERDRRRAAEIQPVGIAAEGGRQRRPWRRNLGPEFNVVGNAPVHETPTANIAVAMEKLKQLPPNTPGVGEIQEFLAAAEDQVNELRSMGSVSTSRRSRRSRRNRGRGDRQLEGGGDNSSHNGGRAPASERKRYEDADDEEEDDYYSDHGDGGRGKAPRERRRPERQRGNRQLGGEVNQPLRQEDLREHLNERRSRIGIQAFSEELKIVRWPKNFRPGDIKSYDGKVDPEHWITLYEVAIRATGGGRDVMANYLPMVMSSGVSPWLLRQRPGSIHSWPQLRQMFIENFKPTCIQPSNKYVLKRIRLRPNESLRQYIRRFSDLWNKVVEITPEESIDAFIDGLCQPHGEDLQKALLLQRPRTMIRLLDIANDHADLEDGMQRHNTGPPKRNFRRNDDYDEDSEGERPFRRQRDRRGRQRSTRGSDQRNDDRPFKRRGQDNYNGGKRNRTRSDNEVNAVKGQKRPNDEAVDKILSQDCPRHPGKGHTLGECRVLSEALVKSVANKKQRPNPKGKAVAQQEEADGDQQDTNQSHSFQEPMKNVTAVIFGGKVGSENSRDKKLLTRAIAALQAPNPESLITDFKASPWSEQPISFSRNDMWAQIPDAGRFPLVLDPVIDGVRFEKVLIDGGSALNILFYPAFKELGIELEKLQPYNTPFWGIMPGKPSYPLGQITLPVQFGTKQHFRIDHITFIVADFEGIYHAILGRPGIAKFMAVPHYGYLVLKLPTKQGILSLRSNVFMARECETKAYAAAEFQELSHALQHTSLEVDNVPPADLEVPVGSGRRPSNKVKQHKIVQLSPDDPSKTTKIGTNLDDK